MKKNEHPVTCQVARERFPKGAARPALVDGRDDWTTGPLDSESTETLLNCNELRNQKLDCGGIDAGAAVVALVDRGGRAGSQRRAGTPGGGMPGPSSANYINGFAGAEFTGKGGPCATLINRILELSGSMPDAAAHRRYLATLSTPALEARKKALEQQAVPAVEFCKKSPPVQFWRHAVRLADSLS